MARGTQDYHQRVFTNDTLLGEDNIIVEDDSVSSGGGDVWRILGAVPAGRFWKLQHLAAVDLTSAITRIQIVTFFGATAHFVHVCLNPGIMELCEWNGTIWLDEGWVVMFGFIGTFAGDWVESYLNGVEVVKR